MLSLEEEVEQEAAKRNTEVIRCALTSVLPEPEAHWLLVQKSRFGIDKLVKDVLSLDEFIATDGDGWD